MNVGGQQSRLIQGCDRNLTYLVGECMCSKFSERDFESTILSSNLELDRDQRISSHGRNGDKGVHDCR